VTPEPEPFPAADPTAPKKTTLLDRFAGNYIDLEYATRTPFSRPLVVGLDVVEHEVIGHLAARFYLIRSERQQLRVAADLVSSTSIAESGNSTTSHALSLGLSDAITLASAGGHNIAVPGPSAAFDPSLEGGGEFHTWGIVGAGLLAPLSQQDRLGYDVGTSLSAVVRQRIKLRGSAKKGLPNVLLSVSETWEHHFPAFTPVLFVENTLWHRGHVVLPLYGPLEVSLEGGFKSELLTGSFLVGGCVQTITGCAQASAPYKVDSFKPLATLDVRLAYRFLPELVAGVGYARQEEPLVSLSGPLYLTDELFHADLAFFPEQLARRFVAPPPPPPAESTEVVKED
jgi:hypothetical protein